MKNKLKPLLLSGGILLAWIYMKKPWRSSKGYTIFISTGKKSK